jgi:hypothetical protein
VAVHVPVLGSYTSAEESEPTKPTKPPSTRTLPLGSRVAVCSVRAVPREPVAVHVPLLKGGHHMSVLGSYSSAEDRSPKRTPEPPAARTLPLGSGVAVCSVRAVQREPVAVHVAVLGSYTSAEDRALMPTPATLTVLPATRTLPLGSSVAVCPLRAVPREPVAVHVPVLGSYTSAEEVPTPPPPTTTTPPPATRTLPLGSSVAVC